MDPAAKMLPKKYLGRWRILEMEQWDKDFIDLTGEGHMIFEKKNRGELHCGVVDCDLDCRIEKIVGQERIEFSFVGMDEGDEVSGRAWAVLAVKIYEAGSIFTMGMSAGSLRKNRELICSGNQTSRLSGMFFRARTR